MNLPPLVTSIDPSELPEKPTRDVSRRRFLKMAAGGAFALAGGSLLGQSFPGATSAGTGKIIRVGVAGGRFGATFQFHLHPNCQVTGVTDLDEGRRQHLQKVYGCEKSYESLEAMVREARDIDAVAIFTDGPLHAEHTRICMERGWHVLCAVPACFSLEEAAMLKEVTQKTGMTYMMAETSYYKPLVISARQFLQEDAFGRIFSIEAEYHHPGLEDLFVDPLGSPTWRRGLPPMHYPTHSTAYLVGVTGERMRSVSCTGWGKQDATYWPNRYNNPFMNETAFFTTDKGNAFRASIFWDGAVRGGDRGQWYGSKMSLFARTPNGQGAGIVRASSKRGADDAGFVEAASQFESYSPPEYWASEMLPERMRVKSGHENSHAFLTHEFIDALVQERASAIDLAESLAMTVPGIVAHQSALEGGTQMMIPDFDD